MEEEQEEVKKELIFIKNIFIKQDEAEGGDEEEKEEGDRESKDNGDLSSQLHCSTPLCEWPLRPARCGGGAWTLTQDQLCVWTWAVMSPDTGSEMQNFLNDPMLL